MSTKTLDEAIKRLQTVRNVAFVYQQASWVTEYRQRLATMEAIRAEVQALLAERDATIARLREALLPFAAQSGPKYPPFPSDHERACKAYNETEPKK